MRSLLIQENPDIEFWNKYSELWYNSKTKSPFQSPELVQYFSLYCNCKTVAFQLINNNKLTGAAILKEEKGVYYFLSDLKTDANWFVFHNECSEEDFYFYFSSLLREVKSKKMALLLNYMPDWAAYMPMFQCLGGNADLFWQSLQYSVSPVMVVKEPGSIFDIVKTSKQFRYSYSKLKKQPDTFFEIFTGDEYLETWADEFCQLHIQRWANTTTPSVYRDKARQVFLLECLKAWSKDEILVRFSVQMSHKRIGLSICLREKNSLIRHSSTYNPEYKKFSPGVALIYAVSEWMTKQHIRLLDFGYGNEEYKYYLANEEQVLSRIFISAKTNLLFIAKAMIIRAVKKNNRLYKFYKQRVKIYFNKK